SYFQNMFLNMPISDQQPFILAKYVPQYANIRPTTIHIGKICSPICQYQTNNHSYWQNMFPNMPISDQKPFILAKYVPQYANIGPTTIHICKICSSICQYQTNNHSYWQNMFLNMPISDQQPFIFSKYVPQYANIRPTTIHIGKICSPICQYQTNNHSYWQNMFPNMPISDQQPFILAKYVPQYANIRPKTIHIGKICSPICQYRTNNHSYLQNMFLNMPISDQQPFILAKYVPQYANIRPTTIHIFKICSSICQYQTNNHSYWQNMFPNMPISDQQPFILAKYVPQYANIRPTTIHIGKICSPICQYQTKNHSYWQNMFPNMPISDQQPFIFAKYVPQYANIRPTTIHIGKICSSICQYQTNNHSYFQNMFLNMPISDQQPFILAKYVPQY